MAYRNFCLWSFKSLLIVLTFGILLHRVVAIKDSEKANTKGYEVKTILDGNKLGSISFGSIHEVITNEGAIGIALNTPNSTILGLSLPFSQNNIVERLSGSLEGKRGYRDGDMNEALYAEPKSLTIDSDGIIYVADAKNRAIRMINTQGIVTTIAGGSNKTGHQDGEGSEATFSYDFELTYLRSTCTLAIADRGNRMIREIQLPQFIGRCEGIGPNSHKSIFLSSIFVICMALVVGILGIIAGGIIAILTLNIEQLEQLQSKFTLHWEHNYQCVPQLNLEEDNDGLNEVLINPVEGDSLQENIEDSILRQQKRNS